MENASKALIIAGAILISILLISAGVAIFQSIKPMQDAATSTGDTYAIQTFNSNFSAYEGENFPASTVRDMISKVNASNASSEHDITIVYNPEDLTVTANGRYDMAFTYTGGYISTITVSKHTT